MADLEETSALLDTISDLPTVDTSGWIHLGGTAAGGYFLAAPGVVVAVPRPGYVQREPDARRSLEEFHRIVAEAGRPHAAIILVDRVVSQDAAARRVWSSADDRGKRSGLALVCSSSLSRAIGSFFIGFNRPQVPTKMFAQFSGALSWCAGRVRQDWERLGVKP